MSRLPSIPSESLAYQTTGDATQPSAELVPLAQQPQVFPRGDEGLLSQVLTLAEAARRAVSQRADQRLVARNDLPKSIAIAIQALRHRVRIGRSLSSHHSV